MNEEKTVTIESIRVLSGLFPSTHVANEEVKVLRKAITDKLLELIKKL